MRTILNLACLSAKLLNVFIVKEEKKTAISFLSLWNILLWMTWLQFDIFSFCTSSWAECPCRGGPGIVKAPIKSFVYWGEHLSSNQVVWYSFVWEIRSQKRRGDKHSRKGNFGFTHQFMVNPNQCLESFGRRYSAIRGSGTWPVLVVQITEHTRPRHVLETSRKTSFWTIWNRKDKH